MLVRVNALQTFQFGGKRERKCNSLEKESNIEYFFRISSRKELEACGLIFLMALSRLITLETFIFHHGTQR